MTKEELKTMLEDAEEMAFQGKCHDCEEQIEVIAFIEGDEAVASGGAVYKVPQPASRGDGIYIKCESCFEKDKVLRNWRKTEVYSRVVGYLRPVGQWNKGKQAEWDQRVTYNTNRVIKQEA